jgi:hypothetical protein
MLWTLQNDPCPGSCPCASTLGACVVPYSTMYRFCGSGTTSTTTGMPTAPPPP